jgi:excinuclease ABC subunit A
VGSRIQILAPIIRKQRGDPSARLKKLKKDGFARVRINGKILELEQLGALSPDQAHDIEVVVDRLVVKDTIRNRLADSLELALSLGDGVVMIDTGAPEMVVFNEQAVCLNCGTTTPELSPAYFSFNSPHGACPDCDGLGVISGFDPDLIIPNPNLSLREGAVDVWANRNSVHFFEFLDSLTRHYGVDIYTPYKDLPDAFKQVLLHGSRDEKIRFLFETDGRKYSAEKSFEGIIPKLQRRYLESTSIQMREEIRRYMSFRACTACGGLRLKPESLAVRIRDRNIAQITALTIEKALKELGELSLDGKDKVVASRILKEIIDRLRFLSNIGVGYLTLDRSAGTLSGGESQRIRLATQIGSKLTGVLYVLDEPSIGLHQRDNQKLLDTLFQMRDMGNTVLVVEHDEETIRKADHVVDMGPGAGANGGEVVFSGTPDRLMDSENSLTGQYLSGKKRIEVPKSRRSVKGNQLVIRGACGNNLKHIDVCFPLGRMICITGVSGSGKSTLLLETVYMGLCQRLHHLRVASGKHRGIEGLEHIDKVVHIDQSPIGKTPRSNPATYTGIFNSIRELFSKTPDSRMRGYGPGRFSFNVKGGRCEACKGDGIIKIEMHFLPDVYVACDVCSGNRYNRETLEIRYKGKTIIDILHMTVNQAYRFFQNIGSIREKLQTLLDVGLGYIQLGQPATTLSGGEAQRIKLARELSKRATGRTVYILDEPTTGLHMEDIRRLLQVLNQLVDSGNTVMVIEHNMDVIKCADYIIDLGPEGGDDGGRIVATGTPEEIARIETSYTGRYLKHMLFTACRDAADSARGS